MTNEGRKSMLQLVNAYASKVEGRELGISITLTDENLAALIADVRRQAMEEAAVICESVPHGGPFAFAIRARLDSPMGKEEGK